MKSKKVLRGWTDYPLCKNSVIIGPTPDVPYQKCPLRKCIVLSWDADKYARVLVWSKFGVGLYDFKLGYTYKTKNTDGISLHTQRNRLHKNGPFPGGEILKLYRVYLKYLSK